MGAAEAASWVATIRALRRHPGVSRAELRAFQDARLRAMVRHAARRVPFYRRLHAGLDVEAFRGLEALAALPRVAKQDLRRVPRREILADDVDPARIAVSPTSGSSGIPFGVWRTPWESRLVRQFRVRAHRQLGIGPRDRLCAIVEPRERGRPRLRRRVLGALGLRRTGGISCFLPAAEIAARLERQAPDAVVGYPSTLAHVATFLSRHGRRGLRPRVVYTGGECLAPEQRRRIEEGFGTRVFDVYGAVELEVVAWECPETGHLHLCEDNFVAEILADGRPVAEGETGELVVSALHNRTLPLLRYGLGDLVERGPAPCPCGQPFATLTRVHGRTIHYLVLPGREAVHPFVITGPLIRGETGWIDRHQLEQEAQDRITLRIAPLAPPPAGALERLERLGREAFGPAVRFRVELVEALPLEPSGKFEPYVSHLQPPRSAP